MKALWPVLGKVLLALVSLALLAQAGSAILGRLRSAGPADADESTREMGVLLKDLAGKVDPAGVMFLVNDQRAEMFTRRLQRNPPTQQRLQVRFMLARELLASGQVEKSLAAIDELERDSLENAPQLWKESGDSAIVLRAMAYLRMAEIQNCCQSNNRDSCLLPIKGGGIHTKREGSKRASAVLEALLDRSPKDLRARWLLNIAHMTLGSYPEGVPTAYRIPPQVFESEHPLPRFDNVAAEVGVELYALAGGAILDDFDNDGLLDLMISSMGYLDQTRYFRNAGDGTFEQRTKEARLTGEIGGLNMIQADYDNDGFVDALVLRGGWMKSQGRFPMSLLRNDGKGRFSDVTKAAGLMHLAPTQTAVWFDYDADGWLDLYVGNESTKGSEDTDKENPCELFHNNRDGTFTNVARELGVDVVAYVKGVTSGDYNNDGRPDLYLSVQNGANLLLRNDGPAQAGGPWRFSEVGREAGVVGTLNTFGTFFFDYDNDGWQDIFVVGYSTTFAEDVAADYLGLPTQSERGRLYHNKHDGTFADVTREAGLYRVVPGMGNNFGDIDNDGYLDIYLATGNPDLSTLVPNRMFRNGEGRVFQDVTTAGNFGHLQKGHAVCFGDIDNDGDQDMFNELGGAFQADKAWSALYENPGNGAHWLSLELEGVRSNRSAIGARIKVTVETEKGSRVVYRTVGSGGSFGASPLKRQDVGLGDAKRIESVEILWPATGKVQSLPGLQLDRRYKVREDAAAAVEVQRPRFVLGGPARQRADLRSLEAR